MLGTRTKQVYAYGRRNQRIINIEDRKQTGDSDLPTETPPVSRVSVRVVTKPKASSPKAAIALKRKKLSPARPKRLQHCSEQDSPEPRSPLALRHSNLPASPATPLRTYQKLSKPSKLKAAFTPFVDVEIVLEDADGTVLQEEKRVTRKGAKRRTKAPAPVEPSTAVPAVIDLLSDNDASPLLAGRLNSAAPRTSRSLKDGPSCKPSSSAEKTSFGRISTSSGREVKPETGFESLSEDESPAQPKPPKLTKARPRTQAILSDNESSEESADEERKDLGQGSYDSHSHSKIRQPQSRRERSPSPQPSLVHEDPLPSHVVVDLIAPDFPLHHKAFAPRVKLAEQKLLAHLEPALPSRQLTPIRRSRANPLHTRLFPRPPSPPSPTTPTDLDFSYDFSSLDCLPDPLSNYTPPPYLESLLEECSQLDTGPHEFSAFIGTFPFDAVVNSDHGGERSKAEFKKIGEASYSEVFGIGDVVLKIVPLRNEDVPAGSSEVEGPPPSDAADVLKEIAVTRAMGDMCPSFVRLLKTYVVKGKYPELLLGLWDEYEDRNGSESIRPDTFALTQTYAIIVLPNGGPDLESYSFVNSSKTGWRRAASIFWQVAKALSKAEELVRFEHRDLHWGQILVRNVSPIMLGPPVLGARRNSSQNTTRSIAETKPMDDPSHGISAMIIDLGLSRMDAGDGSGGQKTIWTAFDEEIFLGEGDYQFDVYRMMRAHNDDAWQEYRPLTNVLWLHYLLLKLIKSKSLKPPRKPTTGASQQTPARNGIRSFTERECYESMLELEKLLGKTASSISKATKGKAKTSKSKSASSLLDWPMSAIEVVSYGVKRDWIKQID